MSTLAYAIPRTTTGGHRSGDDGGGRAGLGWGEGWRDVLREACPLIALPSPVREALAAG
jgi:hypothetical protein